MPVGSRQLGTPWNPIPISTASEFNSQVRSWWHINSGGCYYLTQDIDLLEVGSWWTPIDTFNGFLDGCGHTIKNLNVLSGAGGGFFGFVSSLSWIGRVGIIVGSGGITDNSASYKAPLARDFRGVAYACWATHVGSAGVATGGDRAGGLFGLCRPGSLITDCWAAVPIIGGSAGRVGGLLAFNESMAGASSCYFDSDVAGITATGGGGGAGAARTTANMQASSNWSSYDTIATWDITSGDYPRLKTITRSFFPVSDSFVLDVVVRNSPASCYILTQDIDMQGAPWDGFDFYGVLDGNGFEIKNFFYNTNPDSASKPIGQGLFQTLHEFAVVRYLGVTGANSPIRKGITIDTPWMGVIAGGIEGGIIGQCYVRSLFVNPGSNRAGVIAGFQGFTASGPNGHKMRVGMIRECYAAAEFTSGTSASQIVPVVFRGQTAAITNQVQSTYYDETLAGSVGVGNSQGIARITSSMQVQSNYIGWDFTTVWSIAPNQYPNIAVSSSIQHVEYPSRDLGSITRDFPSSGRRFYPSMILREFPKD